MMLSEDRPEVSRMKKSVIKNNIFIIYLCKRDILCYYHI